MTIKIEITENHFRQLAIGKMVDVICPSGDIDFKDPKIKEIARAATELVDFIKEHKIKFHEK